MCFRKLTAAAVALLFSSSGFCAINANPGFYVGADLTAIHYTRTEGAAFGGFLNNLTPSGAIRPTIGFRFNDYFASGQGGDMELVGLGMTYTFGDL